MTEINQVYKCEICGNIVEVAHAGAGSLVCCGQEMKLLEEHEKENPGNEKHVPIINKTENGFKVVVGLIEHPMLEEHYIEFIELVADNIVYRKFLKPGEKPEAEFCINAQEISARAYCNVHGFWKSN